MNTPSRILLLSLGCLAAGSALAHPGSTAFLQAESQGAEVSLRADYALSDLDDAYGLDADRDGAVTWGEVRAATPAVLNMLSPLLAIQGDGQDCPLKARPEVQIADHSDGAYAVYVFTARCASTPARWTLRSRVLFDLDAQHRALLRWRQGEVEHSTVLTPEHDRYSFTTGSARTDTLRRYWQEGLAHVWSGWDHLLFIAGLFLGAALVRVDGRWQPAPRLGPALVSAAKLVTAFTLAHALTLCLTVLGWVSLPSQLVESLVALSVLFTGLNNLKPIATTRTMFSLAWAFGLIHGTAIAGALLELGLPTSGQLLALLGFNLGVEAAQLLLVLALIPAAFALRHWGGYVPLVLWPGSLLVTMAGLLWFIDRAFDMGWPLPI